jgi:hypothetical protein
MCGATGYVGGMAMNLPIYTSDDNGTTYTEAGGAAPFAALQECQIVELNDGRVMVNARNKHLNKSCDCRAYSISEDGGTTWSPAALYVEARVAGSGAHARVCMCVCVCACACVCSTPSISREERTARVLPLLFF